MLHLILINVLFCHSLVNKCLRPNLKHFAVKVIDFFLCLKVAFLNNKQLNGKKDRRKNAICVGETPQCVIGKCLRTNKVTQYLGACFCYCHSGHLSNPFSKLLYDVALWVSAQGLLWCGRDRELPYLKFCFINTDKLNKGDKLNK